MPQPNQTRPSPDHNDTGTPGAPRDASASQSPDTLLFTFLAGNDADCPICGYNLRGLTRPVCPECRQDLFLTVGVKHLQLGWLLLALAPCFFAGIAACFVAIPTTGMYFEDGTLVMPLAIVVLFGWTSGIFAIILAFRTRLRNRFIALSRKKQRWFALLIWLTHFLALAGFIALMIPLI